MPDSESDHYSALGVSPDAEADEIRAAWRFQLAAFHPDKFRDDEQRERAEEITKRANAAWQVLGHRTATGGAMTTCATTAASRRRRSPRPAASPARHAPPPARSTMPGARWSS